MKVLVVSSWCPSPPVNGSKLRAFHLVRQLADRHAVTLATFVGPNDDPYAAPLREACRSIHAVQGEPFLFGRTPGSSGLFSSWPRSLKQTYNPEMERLVAELAASADLVLALQVTAAVYMNAAEATPWVFEEVELTTFREAAEKKERWRRRWRAGLTWWKQARFVRGLIGKAAGATVVSSLERDELRRVGVDVSRVAVVPNGVDPADLLIEPAPSPDTLIYPGAPTYPANLDAVRYFLRDIWPLILEARPNVHLRVTGDTSGMPLAQLPAADGVVFTGHVPDIRRLIADTQVSIAPIRIGGGTRLKILESMALGVPVVSTTKGAEGLDVTDGRDILLADSPRTFADQVLRLLEDAPLRARVSAEARRLVEQRYTWTASGATLEVYLANCLARAGRAH